MRTSACPVGEIVIFGGAMSDDGQQRFGDEALQELFAEFPGRLVSPGGAAALLGLKRETSGHRPSSSQALRQLVIRVTKRAGIAAHVSPHDMRPAYAEHIARKTDIRIAQHLLGHAHLGTTDTYLGRPRLDDMVAAVRGVTYGVRTNVLGVAEDLQIGLKATTGIEPV
jgi:site-specific recombinase XerC